jgi:hypothetical protein
MTNYVRYLSVPHRQETVEAWAEQLSDWKSSRVPEIQNVRIVQLLGTEKKAGLIKDKEAALAAALHATVQAQLTSIASADCPAVKELIGEYRGHILEPDNRRVEPEVCLPLTN